MIQDHVCAETAKREFGIEKAVDHRQPVLQHIGKGARDKPSRAAFRRTETIFDQHGLDGRLLDHGDVIEQAHIRHAAAGVPAREIGLQQRELFARCFRRNDGAHKIGVDTIHTAHSAADNKFFRDDTNRNTRRAAVARRTIGDHLAAAKTGMGECVVQWRSVRSDETREHFTLHLAGQIRAGTAWSKKELG